MFLTIISGVFVFILSQYILEFILKPLKEYRKVIAEIDNKLKFYANVIVNPPVSDQLSEDYLAARNEIKKLSCDLESAYKNLLLFRPKQKSISEAARELIWLSIVIGHKDAQINLPLKSAEKMDNIRELLKIPEL